MTDLNRKSIERKLCCVMTHLKAPNTLTSSMKYSILKEKTCLHDLLCRPTTNQKYHNHSLNHNLQEKSNQIERFPQQCGMADYQLSNPDTAFSKNCSNADVTSKQEKVCSSSDVFVMERTLMKDKTAKMLSASKQLKVFNDKPTNTEVFYKAASSFDSSLTIKQNYLKSLRDYIRIRLLLLEDDRLHHSIKQNKPCLITNCNKLLDYYIEQKERTKKVFNETKHNKVLFNKYLKRIKLLQNETIILQNEVTERIRWRNKRLKTKENCPTNKEFEMRISCPNIPLLNLAVLKQTDELSIKQKQCSPYPCKPEQNENSPRTAIDSAKTSEGISSIQELIEEIGDATSEVELDDTNYAVIDEKHYSIGSTQTSNTIEEDNVVEENNTPLENIKHDNENRQDINVDDEIFSSIADDHQSKISEFSEKNSNEFDYNSNSKAPSIKSLLNTGQRREDDKSTLDKEKDLQNKTESTTQFNKTEYSNEFSSSSLSLSTKLNSTKHENDSTNSSIEEDIKDASESLKSNTISEDKNTSIESILSTSETSSCVDAIIKSPRTPRSPQERFITKYPHEVKSPRNTNYFQPFANKKNAGKSCLAQELNQTTVDDLHKVNSFSSDDDSSKNTVDLLLKNDYMNNLSSQRDENEKFYNEELNLQSETSSKNNVVAKPSKNETTTKFNYCLMKENIIKKTADTIHKSISERGTLDKDFIVKLMENSQITDKHDQHFRLMLIDWCIDIAFDMLKEGGKNVLINCKNLRNKLEETILPKIYSSDYIDGHHKVDSIRKQCEKISHFMLDVHRLLICDEIYKTQNEWLDLEKRDRQICNYALKIRHDL